MLVNLLPIQKEYTYSNSLFLQYYFSTVLHNIISSVSYLQRSFFHFNNKIYLWESISNPLHFQGNTMVFNFRLPQNVHRIGSVIYSGYQCREGHWESNCTKTSKSFYLCPQWWFISFPFSLFWFAPPIIEFTIKGGKRMGADMFHNLSSEYLSKIAWVFIQIFRYIS